MGKMKAFGVVLLMLIAAACQSKDRADNSAPVSRMEPSSQSAMAQVTGRSSESAADSSEPVAASEHSMEQALRGAPVLTEHLMNRVFHEGIVERGEDVTDRELFYFFTTLPGYMQNRDHPYDDTVILTPANLYIFPEELVRQAAYELFGVENWGFDEGIVEYNAGAGQYESELAFGTGVNQYSCSDLQAVYFAERNAIEVSFELEGAASIDGDPGWEPLGRYIARYQVVQENGMFLRYESIQKAQ